MHSVTAPQDANVEEEANAFARELLMPKRLVAKEIKKLGGLDLIDQRPKKLAVLARRFRVSEPLMAFRLGELHRSNVTQS